MQDIQVQTHDIAALAAQVHCFDEASLAFLAGVKLSTLNTWRKRGEGPSYCLFGNNYLYPIGGVEAFLASVLKIRTKILPESVLI